MKKRDDRLVERSKPIQPRASETPQNELLQNVPHCINAINTTGPTISLVQRGWNK